MGWKGKVVTRAHRDAIIENAMRASSSQTVSFALFAWKGQVAHTRVIDHRDVIVEKFMGGSSAHFASMVFAWWALARLANVPPSKSFHSGPPLAARLSGQAWADAVSDSE